MVDCHPEQTMSTEAELRLTMLFEGGDLPCHPVKNVICILLYRMSRIPTQLQYDVILLYSILFCECHDVAKNAMTAAIGLSIWTVRVYISRSRHFLNVNLPSLILV